MKKTLLIVIALLLISSNLVASGDSDRCESQGGSWEWNGNTNQWQCNETAPAAEEEVSWPFACDKEDLAKYKDNRYFLIGSNYSYPVGYSDTRTIKIDKKNKIIDMWQDWLSSEENRQLYIKDFGKDDDYSDFGVYKQHTRIDYKNLKSKRDTVIHYTCKGNVIYTSDVKNESWTKIVPGTSAEGMIDILIEKYNLK